MVFSKRILAIVSIMVLSLTFIFIYINFFSFSNFFQDDGVGTDNINTIVPPQTNESSPSQKCGECHIRPLELLNAGGGKHAQQECSYCHPQHGFKPRCVDCHGFYHPSGFEECKQCHTSAHSPLDIRFSEQMGKEDCEQCHASIVKSTFLANPTKHAQVDCQQCHPVHGEWLACTSCHEPHNEDMSPDDCQLCHVKGHVPTYLDFPSDTPSEFCGSCHQENAQKLRENITGHSDKRCAYCHPQHGQIPECTTCHGSKHGMVSGCITCHGEAHDLVSVSTQY